MTMAELIYEARGLLKIAEYLKANPEVFQKYLDGECDAGQLTEFAKLHLSKYPKLAQQVTDKVEFLERISQSDDKTEPLVPAGKPFPMIEVGAAQRGAYIPPGGAGVTHDERVGLCGCGL